MNTILDEIYYEADNELERMIDFNKWAVKVAQNPLFRIAIPAFMKVKGWITPPPPQPPVRDPQPIETPSHPGTPLPKKVGDANKVSDAEKRKRENERKKSNSLPKRNTPGGKPDDDEPPTRRDGAAARAVDRQRVANMNFTPVAAPQRPAVFNAKRDKNTNREINEEQTLLGEIFQEQTL